MTAQPEHLMVVTTCAAEDEAVKIATALVSERAAACCNVVKGVRSRYVWQGKLEDSAEILLLIKTTAGAFSRVREIISNLHSYEIPEIIALPIIDGAEDYLRWIAEQIRP